MEDLHSPVGQAKSVYSWYEKAQVDYVVLFINLYIAYTTWYREVVHTSNDREALSALKKRYVIWDDYRQGKVLSALLPYMKRLVELTQQSPYASSNTYWNGEVENAYDWRSLIEFWYQTRCLIVHGSDFSMRYVWLAYETLSIFMAEIISRMQACMTDAELEKVRTISLESEEPGKSERLNHLRQKLYNKYIASPNIWQVDMQRVKN